jgi:hypothetical protein
MRLVKIDREAKQHTPPAHRLVLSKGELYRLPAPSQVLRVLSGTAWVTLAGQDIFLEAGEKRAFTVNGDIALVSALGRAPLTLEVGGDEDLGALGTLSTPRHHWQRAA